MKRLAIGPFLGPITALDPTAVPANRAVDCLNVRLEDGTIRPRYGVNILRGQEGGFLSVWGYEYLEGYNSSDALVSEFVAFKNSGLGGTKPYVETPAGVSTELKNGASSVSLDSSVWRGVSWRDVGYLFNPSDTVGVYKYTLGTTNTLTPLNNRTAPATALAWDIVYGSAANPYSQLSWAGISVSADIVYGGQAQQTNSTVRSDGSLQIGHTSNTGQASATITLDGATGPGQQNFTYNDIFAFLVYDNGPTLTFQIDPQSMKVEFITSGGATLTPSSISFSTISSQNGRNTYAYRVEFYDKTRASFAQIKKIKFTYNVIDTGGTNYDLLTFDKMWLGGVRIVPATDVNISQQRMAFGYTYTDSVGESPVGGVVKIYYYQLGGYDPIASVNSNVGGLGVHLRFTVTNPGGSVASWTLYVLDDVSGTTDRWLQVANTAIGTLTYTYRITWPEALRLTEFTPRAFASGNVVGAFQFRGWMVWLYAGGYQNIRHSWVGNPERQYASSDDINDATRGANYSMADNFGDEPLCGFACADACIYVGSIGIYAQTGDAPSTMTPSKKLPGSFGCPGQFAACRWHDEVGQPGVVALSRKGDGVYFYAVDQSFDGSHQGFKVVELSAEVREQFRTFLQGGLSDLSGAIVQVDENQDALWVILGRRAMVLRRSNLATGARHWEFYEYNLGNTVTVAYAPFSARWGARWYTSSGAVHLVDRTLSGAPITGTNRDAGFPIASAYWKSKVFTSEFNSRVDAVDCYRDDLTNTPTVQVISTRQTSSKTWTSGKRHARFGKLQQGFEHQFKLSISENDSAYHRLIVDIKGPIGKRILS